MTTNSRVFRSRLLFPLLLVLGLGILPGCKRAFLKKPTVEAFNEGKKSIRLQALKDIYFRENNTIDSTRLVFKKGTVLEIRLEAGEDWIRVRGRDLSRPEEQNPGGVILFYVSDPESKETAEQALKQMEEYLNTILIPAKAP